MGNLILIFLDDDLNPVSFDVPYDNLVWVSRYYDFGEFQVQVPAKFFDQSWKFVMCSAHRELGIVLKYDYDSSSGKVLISGKFAEWALDYSLAFPRFKKNGEVGSLCTQLVSTYYMRHPNETSDTTSAYDFLPIQPYGDYTPPTGRYYEANFMGENLGTKIFSMLRKDEMSFKVNYSRSQKKCYFMLWKGRDRRGDANSVNENALILSEAMGSLTDIKLSYDVSAYRNLGVTVFDFDSETETFSSVSITHRGDYSRGNAKSWYWETNSTSEETIDEHFENFNNAVNIDARLTDDEEAAHMLGDLVTLRIESVNLKIDTRVAEVTFTYKDGTRDVEVGFGDKRVSNLDRAIGVLK